MKDFIFYFILGTIFYFIGIGLVFVAVHTPFPFNGLALVAGLAVIATIIKND